jgi:hypothetical protein
MPGAEISVGHAALLQTLTAVVQAIVSISLLAWYVLTAHLERIRISRERLEDFTSLVMLCRDLGIEAKNKTEAHHREISAISDTSVDDKEIARSRLTLWKADMTVIYVCLNEVPHYEVRNPAFSTALTRLWMEVDARSVRPEQIEQSAKVASFLELKRARICAEVDAMADLLDDSAPVRRSQERLGAAAKRPGKIYAANGSVRENAEYP